METMTVKRNGILIVFPKMENAPIKGECFSEKKQNYIRSDFSTKGSNRRVKTPTNNALKKNVAGKEKARARMKNKCKRCIWCNEPVFYGSHYCWDHYKYEHFESR